MTTDSKVNLILGMILIVSALSVEWLSTYFMVVLSRFYEAIISENQQLFFHELQFACILSFSTSILKSVKKYCAQYCSLNWRLATVQEIQKCYFGPFGTAMKNVLRSLDNVDQRITQDIENLSFLYADLAEKVIVVPFIIAYYSYYLVALLGWWSIVIALGYFLLGAIVGSILTNRLVPIVYNQEVVEGNFRFFHSGIRMYHWMIVLLKGLPKEKTRADAFLEKVVANKRKFIDCAFSVDVFSSWFDYTGSIGRSTY